MKFKKLFLFLAAFVIILIFFSLIDIYVIKTDLLVGRFFSKIIPFPAIYVNGSYISYNNYEQFLEDYRIYFLSNKDISQDLYRQDAIKKIIGINFTSNLANKLNVKCYKDDIFYEFKKSFYLQNNISESVMLDLKNQYGFNENKFEKYVVLPAYCREKISNQLLFLKENKEKRKQIDEIYSIVIKNPDQFLEYSNKYRDKNIPNIKTIGWLPKNDLPAGLIDIVDDMKLSDISPVMESLVGYHIYKIDGMVNDSVNNQKFFQLSQIFIPIKSLDDYMTEYLANGKIMVLIP